MGIFMSIPHPDSVGKVRKILRFETVFHDSASDCTKLTLASESESHRLSIEHELRRNLSSETANCIYNSHSRIIPTAIAAHQLDFRMSPYPSFRRFRLAVG